MSTIVITGSSAGIGRAAAVALADLGHHVAVVGRNPERTKAVAEQIGGAAFVADFSHLSEVRRLAAELEDRYDRIDVLANNAGGFNGRRVMSEDGIEITWQNNVLAPFILTSTLAPLLRDSGARVIMTGSSAQGITGPDADDPSRERSAWGFGWPAYGASKRADIMLAKEFGPRLGLDAYSFHPGFVATNFADLNRSIFEPLVRAAAKTPEAGAAPLVFLASGAEVDVPPGTFFDSLKPFGRVARQVEIPAERARLWAVLEAQAAAHP